MSGRGDALGAAEGATAPDALGAAEVTTTRDLLGAAEGTTARDVLVAAVPPLAAAGCPTPRLDAELLLADALGVRREALYLDSDLPVSPAAAHRAADRFRRRAHREPVAYLLGRKGFRRLELTVDRRVLVPRPETELLVEVALRELPDRARVHDVGTGSGAIALALKDERPDLLVSASDASPDALAVARANAARLGLDVDLGLARGLPPGDYGLVVANLPYVSDPVWATMSPDVIEYEPAEALRGGPDGLREIRALVAGAPSGTRLALEHAPQQAAAVRAMLERAESHRDVSGEEYVTTGRVP